LEPLQRQRELTVDEETALLAERLREAEQSSRQREQLQSELQRAQSQRLSDNHSEASRVRAGAVNAADLTRQASHDERARAFVEELQRRASQAHEQEQAAQARTQAQQDKLGSAVAGADAVRGHRQRWHREQQRKSEKRDEESAHDNWAARNRTEGR
jgi:hypothetical protein